MNLTSLHRVKSFMGYLTAEGVNSSRDADIQRLIPTVSGAILRYLKRDVELKTWTEYFDPREEEKVFYPKAYPITSVTSIHTDWTGKYAGSETLVPAADYILDGESRSIVISPVVYTKRSLTLERIFPKSLRVIYQGGLASTATASTFATGSESGAFTVGRYAYGSISSAVGRVVSTGAGTITLDVLYGVFEVGDVLLEREGLDATASPSAGVSKALTSITTRSLAEAAPGLSWACEMEVRYALTNQFTAENARNMKDGQDRSGREELRGEYNFLPETRRVLDQYRNKYL